jgi:hypothetical protein
VSAVSAVAAIAAAVSAIAPVSAVSAVAAIAAAVASVASVAAAISSVASVAAVASMATVTAVIIMGLRARLRTRPGWGAVGSLAGWRGRSRGRGRRRGRGRAGRLGLRLGAPRALAVLGTVGSGDDRSRCRSDSRAGAGGSTGDESRGLRSGKGSSHGGRPCDRDCGIGGGGVVESLSAHEPVVGLRDMSGGGNGRKGKAQEDAVSDPHLDDQSVESVEFKYRLKGKYWNKRVDGGKKMPSAKRVNCLSAGW